MNSQYGRRLGCYWSTLNGLLPKRWVKEMMAPIKASLH